LKRQDNKNASILTAMLLRPGINPVLATQELMKAGEI